MKKENKSNDNKRLVVDLMYEKSSSKIFEFDIRGLISNVYLQLTAAATPTYLSTVEGMEAVKGQFENCLMRFKFNDRAPPSNRVVSVSHIVGAEETINIVFTDLSVQGAAFSKTRHYQPMKYLGQLENKTQRSHHYAAMVTRQPVEELTKDIFNFLYKGELPLPFNQDLHKEFFQAVDKDRYKAAEGV